MLTVSSASKDAVAACTSARTHSPSSAFSSPVAGLRFRLRAAP